MKTVKIFFALALALALSGCVVMDDPEVSQEYRAHAAVLLEPGQPVGQTFVMRRPGLNGIQLWLRPAPGAEKPAGSVVFRLFRSPGDSQPLVVSTISTAGLAEQSQTGIAFPARQEPPSHPYYLELSVEKGVLEVMGRDENAYPWGQAFANGQTVDADLAFRTSYAYNLTNFWFDARAGLAGAWLLLPLVITLWAPGRLVLLIFRLDQQLDWGERTALSASLSLALIPILMSWTTLAGLNWSRSSVWIAGALLLSTVLVLLWRERRQASAGLRIDKAGLALASVFLLALVVRLVMVRDVAAPPWVDSVHHAMITRLILEEGAFPSSYAPYLDVETANYHPGFHSTAAVFIWLSGQDLAQGLLLFGQVLNALVVFAVYLLTTSFTGRRSAGVAAALLAGLFTPMPAYYTSWGRYTQLASLMILPAAAALLLKLLHAQPKQRAALLGLSAVASGGLFLTHYRVVVFLGCLLIAYLYVETGRAIWSKSFWRRIPRQAGWLVAAALAAVLLTLPWWPSTLQTLLIPKLAWGAGTAERFADFSWGLLTSGLGRYTLVLAALGMVWSLLQRRPFSLVMGLWVLLMLLAANLKALGLPAGGYINNLSVVITLFMPVAVLAGYLIGWLFDTWNDILPTPARQVYWAIIAAAGLALAWVGARSLLPILNPTTILFRETDRPALAWIETNIPAAEAVAINPMAWGYGLWAGNDGGYWMAPLAGRPSMPPNVLYSLGNRYEEQQAISEFSRRLNEIGSRPEELHSLLSQRGIRYVYTGARGGSISARALGASPLFEILYGQNGTWVFRAR